MLVDADKIIPIPRCEPKGIYFALKYLYSEEKKDNEFRTKILGKWPEKISRYEFIQKR